jgi:hypothetical protein
MAMFCPCQHDPFRVRWRTYCAIMSHIEMAFKMAEYVLIVQ